MFCKTSKGVVDNQLAFGGWIHNTRGGFLFHFSPLSQKNQSVPHLIKSWNNSPLCRHTFRDSTKSHKKMSPAEEIIDQVTLRAGGLEKDWKTDEEELLSLFKSVNDFWALPFSLGQLVNVPLCLFLQMRVSKWTSKVWRTWSKSINRDLIVAIDNCSSFLVLFFFSPTEKKNAESMNFFLCWFCNFVLCDLSAKRVWLICEDISVPRELFSQQNKTEGTQVSSNDQRKRKECIFLAFVIWWNKVCCCFGTEISHICWLQLNWKWARKKVEQTKTTPITVPTSCKFSWSKQRVYSEKWITCLH